MATELNVKIIKKLAVESGTSAKGDWSKQDLIVETQEQFPKKVCMNVWGKEKVEELAKFKDGATIKASINIESREFNNRWYTEIRAWKMEQVESTATSQAEVEDLPEDKDDGLPY